MRNKSIQILRLINKDEINMQELQKQTFTGIPDTLKCLRPILWRVILGNFSPNPSEWQSSLDQNYETYEGFKKELIVKP